MGENFESKSSDLNDLLELFTEHVTVADITADSLLGKISASIAKKRIDLNMTQKEFASHIGVTQGMISKWEGGDYNFSIKSLADIAEKLNMDLAVNLSSNKRDARFTHIRNENITYVFSEPKRFVGKNSKSINYMSKTQIERNTNECKVYSFSERLEM